MCAVCGVNRVAWTDPRVDYCYSCLPGGPFTAPRCSCGSGAYFSQGLCERCHPGAPRHLGSCKDCLAWGVLRANNWRCWTCRGWRARHAVADCPSCTRPVPLGDMGVCRLCYQQAVSCREPQRPFDLMGANRYGQQLFLANLAPGRARTSARLARPPIEPVRPDARQDIQLALFAMARDLTQVTGKSAVSTGAAADLERVLADHAAAHGWHPRHLRRVRLSLRLLQETQDTPGAPITATQVKDLTGRHLPVESTLEVLRAAGMLEDDRLCPVRAYFLTRAAGLPEPMGEQLRLWLDIMIDGSTRPPRRLPRHPATVHHHVRFVTRTAHLWAEAGYTSLSEVTQADVRAAIAASDDVVNLTAALHGLFAVLKGRRKLFADPTKGISTGSTRQTVPMPLDTAVIREALDSRHPAAALATALVVFHALTARQVRDLRLSDAHDGRLSVGERSLPLAAPVRTRLGAWLDHRERTWPETINPYLLINRRTAPRTCPVGPNYPWIELGVRPQALREDRILAEIHATGGDLRRICDLFGLSIAGATRYAWALEHPDLRGDQYPGT